PMPFADKFSRDPANVLLPDVRDAPDPNIGLYGKDRPGGNIPDGPTDLATTPLPGRTQDGNPPPVPAGPDNIGDLIATLTKPKAPAAPAPAKQPPPDKPAPGTEAPADAGKQTTYYLQAGAFRSEGDAEAVMARIVMLGLPAQVQK